MRSKAKQNVHWGIAYVVLSVALATVWGAFTQINEAIYSRTGPGTPLIPYNEVSRYALETRVDHLKTLFTFAIGSIAGLWGILILKPEETRWIVGSPQQRIMLGAAHLLLLASVGVASFYQWMITDALFQCAAQRTPALMIFGVSKGPLLTVWIDAQLLLVFGIMTAGAAVAGAHLFAPPEMPVTAGTPAAPAPPPVLTAPMSSGSAPQSQRRKRY